MQSKEYALFAADIKYREINTIYDKLSKNSILNYKINYSMNSDASNKIDGLIENEFTNSTNFEEGKTLELSRVSEDKNYDLFYRGFESIIFTSISNEYFESGIISKTSELILDFFSNNTKYTKKAIQKMSLDFFDSSKIQIGILDGISYIDFELIKDDVLSVVISALSHYDDEVVEYAIRCFENWRNVKSLKQLKSIKCREKWMNIYLEKIINELELELS